VLIDETKKNRYAAAYDALASGKLGVELKDHICVEAHNVSAADLCKVILESSCESKKSFPCFSLDQYGVALIYLVKDDIKEQMSVLHEVYMYCEQKCFPIIEATYGKVALISWLFGCLYESDIIEPEAFIEWCETYVNICNTALFQITKFLNLLRDELNPDSDTSDDESSEDDDSNHIQYQKHNNSIADNTNKQNCKVLKRERRDARVAARD
jgi:hypothetical protein